MIKAMTGTTMGQFIAHEGKVGCRHCGKDISEHVHLPPACPLVETKTTAEERALWRNLTGWPKNARQRFRDMLDDLDRALAKISELEQERNDFATRAERAEKVLANVRDCQHGWKVRCPSCLAIIEYALEQERKE